MKILRNSAKCTACGIEIESKTRHDFNVHYCAVEPTQGTDGETWRFAVDGGKNYVKRCGEGFTDTSIYESA